MSGKQFTLPDVLVLGGGGVLGEAWMMGVLAGIEDATGVDMRRVDAFLGTSAGAIVAARLAAGQRPRRPKGDRPHPDVGLPGRPSALETLTDRLISPVASLALRVERTPGAVLRGAVLRMVPPGTRNLEDLERSLERDGGAFDGRLRIVAVDRSTGRRVVFGAPGAPPASVARAVVASCSIPAYFRPVSIEGRDYVDGGAWSHTNLDAAPAGAQTEVLCLNPIQGLSLALDSPLNAARAVLRARQAVELATLRGRGATVRVLGPASGGPAEPMALNLMDRTHASAVLAGGYSQGLSVGQG